MTDITMTADRSVHSNFPPRQRMPVTVQILSTMIFGGFAIVAVALAFDSFWPAGVALAIILGWRGGFAPQISTAPNADEIVEKIRALSPEATQRSSGNASFDAYRNDMLSRLEDEQQSFETFLDQLRSAKDKHEFDGFMDERVHAAPADDATA